MRKSDSPGRWFALSFVTAAVLLAATIIGAATLVKRSDDPLPPTGAYPLVHLVVNEAYFFDPEGSFDIVYVREHQQAPLHRHGVRLEDGAENRLVVSEGAAVATIRPDFTFSRRDSFTLNFASVLFAVLAAAFLSVGPLAFLAIYRQAGKRRTGTGRRSF